MTFVETIWSSDCDIARAHHFINEYLDPNVKVTGLLPGTRLTIDGFRRVYDAIKHALPDINVAVYDVVAEGELVWAKYVKLGRFTGAGGLYGFPPTGKKVRRCGLRHPMGLTWSCSRCQCRPPTPRLEQRTKELRSGHGRAGGDQGLRMLQGQGWQDHRG
jgi:predicted ester cyclase